MKKTDAQSVPPTIIARSARGLATPRVGLGARLWGRPAGGAEGARVPLETDAVYTCPSCFETNYLAVDPSGGGRQRFAEDCPVCCHPIDFEVTLDSAGDPTVVSAELES